MLVNTDELIVANKEIAILRPQIHGTGILKFFLPFDCKLESIHITENTQIKENDVNVISIAARDFVLNQRDKSLLLIALFQLKERIQNNQLDIKVQEC